MNRKVLSFFGGLLLGVVASHFVQLAGNGYAFLPHRFKAYVETNGASVFHPNGSVSSHMMESAPCITAPTSTQLDIPDKLYKKVRILCLIMTHPGNYKTKAVAVNNTWASRCNRYAFIGTNETTVDIPVIRLNITDGYTMLWQKVWMSLDYADKAFGLNNFDYVLKADDDTYVVLENLRLLLLPLDPGRPIHLGRQFIYDRDERQQYMSGGAGYVLSRAAVKLFLDRIVRTEGPKMEACDLQRRVSEDWMVGTCMTSLGVKLVKSLDSNGLDRFHPLNPEYMIGHSSGEMPKWMWKMNYYKFRACLRSCVSPVTITFHYISDMYLTEFLLYGMRPVGVDPTVNEAAPILKFL